MPEPPEDQPGQMHFWKQRGLGFMLTLEGIKPGKNKLKAIQNEKALNDVKTIRSFMGLGNFFRTHIKIFAVVAKPLFKLIWKNTKGAPCQNRPWTLSLTYEINWF
jgi:hypothetical protein